MQQLRVQLLIRGDPRIPGAIFMYFFLCSQALCEQREASFATLGNDITRRPSGIRGYSCILYTLDAGKNPGDSLYRYMCCTEYTYLCSLVRSCHD